MVKAVGVVGGGIMGSGIAEVAARSGCDVVLREVNEAAVEGAQRTPRRFSRQGRPQRQTRSRRAQ